MLTSVIVYTLLAIALWLLGYHVNSREQKLCLTTGESALNGEKTRVPFYSWEILLAIFLVTVVIGFKWNVGDDFMMYYKSFDDLLKYGEFQNRENFEIGYYCVNKLISFTLCRPIFFFAVWTLAQASLFYFALRDRKFLLPWMGMLLILGPMNLNWLTFMRQWTISFMLMAAMPWVIERKPVPYFLMVLFAMTIHKSALLLALFYFAPLLVSENPHRWRYLVVFLLCVALGAYPIWFKAFTWIPDVVYWAGYERYDYLLEPLRNLEFHFYTWGPNHIASVLLSLVFIWYYPKLKTHFKDDKFLGVSFVLAFACVCFDNLVLNTNYIFRRPCDYLYVFQWVMLAYTMAYLKDKKQYFVLTALCILACVSTYVILYKCAYMHISDKMLYHFYFFQ